MEYWSLTVTITIKQSTRWTTRPGTTPQRLFGNENTSTGNVKLRQGVIEYWFFGVTNVMEESTQCKQPDAWYQLCLVISCLKRDAVCELWNSIADYYVPDMYPYQVFLNLSHTFNFLVCFLQRWTNITKKHRNRSTCVVQYFDSWCCGTHTCDTPDS